MKNKALHLVSVYLVIFFSVVPFSVSASCSSLSPNTGDTVTCSGTGISSVSATPGSSNVTIIIDSTATGRYSLPTQATPFSVGSISTITNRGALSLSGNGTGVANRGALVFGVNDSNVLTNDTSGSLTTTGAYNDGMAANGNYNTLVNKGTISTSGNNSYGMTAAWGQSNPGSVRNTIINIGTVTTAGDNARAASLLGGGGQLTTAVLSYQPAGMRRRFICRATTPR